MAGLRNVPRLFSARTVRAHVAGLQDRVRGLDFLSMVRPEEVGLDPAAANPCTASGDRWLRAVLRELPITEADAVVDIGCGKGSAMRLMLSFPFARVDGVEAGPPLAQIARTNFARLGVGADRCTVFTADATTFPGLDPYTYVYLSNPFPCAVMRRFLENLTASAARAPRPLTIVYGNPVCAGEITSTGMFRRVAEYPDDWGNGIAVFSNSDA